MRLAFLYILGISLALLTSIGCATTEDQDEFILEYDRTSAFSESSRGVFKGEAVVMTTDGGDIVVSLASEDRQKVDRIFTLQREEEAGLEEDLGRSLIYYVRGNAFIRSEKGINLHLAVSDFDLASRADEVARRGMDVQENLVWGLAKKYDYTTYPGWALSSHNVNVSAFADKSFSLTDARSRDSYQRGDTFTSSLPIKAFQAGSEVSTGKQGPCVAGGPGSTGCSLPEFCSITCGDGYYACCAGFGAGPNGERGFCVKEDGDEMGG